MDFSIPDPVRELVGRYREFVKTAVMPLESRLGERWGALEPALREELRHLQLEERLDAHLVEIGQLDRRGQPAGLGRDLRSGLLSHPRPGEDAVKLDAAATPVLPEQPRLLLAQRREAIVVVLEGGRLPVADEIKSAHASAHKTLTQAFRQGGEPAPDRL